MMPVSTARGMGGDPPRNEGQMSVPDAIVSVLQLITQLEEFVERTDYLTTPIMTEEGEQHVHPGSFAIGNLKKIRLNLLTTYGEQMWKHGASWSKRFDAPTVDHPTEDTHDAPQDPAT